MPADSKSRSRLVDAMRERLFRELGGVCAEASEECDGPLTIDHPNGRAYKPSRLASYNRWLRYRHEHERGEVRLLCHYHNNIIRPKPVAYEAAEQPF
jgi:hypothetical protein